MRSRRSQKLSHTQTSVPCGTLNELHEVNNVVLLVISVLYNFNFDLISPDLSPSVSEILKDFSFSLLSKIMVFS